MFRLALIKKVIMDEIQKNSKYFFEGSIKTNRDVEKAGWDFENGEEL